jgi:hypothetical protein
MKEKEKIEVSENDSRLEINLTEVQQLHEQSRLLLEEIEKNKEESIYQYGGILVRLENKLGELKICQLNKYMLRHIASKTCKFIKDYEALNEIHPPMYIIEDALATGNYSFPEIKGIIRHPLIKKNGDIIFNSGFDNDTGIYIDYKHSYSFDYINLKDNFTKNEIENAIKTINYILSDFPFKNISDKANLFSFVFTCLCRNIIEGLIPLFLIKSPTPGTGKTLLVTIILLILTGKIPAITPLPDNEAEIRKLIFSFLLEGADYIFFDNIKGKFSSETINSTITSGRFRSRILQRSKTADLIVKSPIIVTANNPDIDRELGRRIVPIELSIDLENPASRNNFKIDDLIDYVKKNRDILLESFIILIKSYFLNGQKEQYNISLGSFEEWSLVSKIKVEKKQLLK